LKRSLRSLPVVFFGYFKSVEYANVIA